MGGVLTCLLSALKAHIVNGQIALDEPAELAEGAELLVFRARRLRGRTRTRPASSGQAVKVFISKRAGRAVARINAHLSAAAYASRRSRS
jgi:hypothetical protein